ncbi:alkaline phosphatase [Telmatospirillum sp.]|uniref:alkaline phosphatase n=1 Tax=Telmatospirillum sp. TaxID=2079197 RepID=UPI002850A4B9|nr:alkaline phosphatase [Telmatospirillum sp.]MDR3435968.1 alkaline phosphatase [Telmatospirillum sp.]
MISRISALAAALMLSAAGTAFGQTIYPLDRAEILAGSQFDFKVEFPPVQDASAVSVTINGQDAKSVLTQPADFLPSEDGERSALWIRGATLAKPGKYVVEATVRGAEPVRVTWEVFATPARKAKNVILFIGDGMSVAHRTAARILSKGLKEGRYGGELAIDDMPYMALVSTSGTDSVVTDSANSMSAYTTGHKSCVNALGVYCAHNKNTLDHPKVETIAELVKRRSDMAVGVVTNTEIEDATPAGMVSHTRRRADYNDIVGMFYQVQPDVIMGGGSPNFLPKSTPGSKRTDDKDFLKQFQDAGYSFVTSNTELKAAVQPGHTAKKLLGLFNTGNMDGALDRRLLKKGSVDKFPDQPDLTDQVGAALDILSKRDKGFVLMVESGHIDKYSHVLDWERAIFDTIMLDNAVKLAKDFAAKKNDTLVIVVADHAHPVSIVGTYDDDRKGDTARDKLGVYDEAKFPNYPPADAEGYPTSVEVSRRLAFVFGAFPDHCDTIRPHTEGPNVPAVKGDDGKYIANEKNCSGPQAVRRTGNLPTNQPQDVHAADDVVLTAIGPGAEQFHGRIDNTRVFRYMANALGLAKP